MKKSFVFILTSLFILCFFFSCEIGLGSSVDTESPVLSIEYPEPASIVRDSFVIAGNCTDDSGVTSVSVKVMNTDQGNKVYGTYNADIKDNTWSITLNGDGPYNGYAYPDGRYVVNVQAFDASGKSSGVSSLSFDVDNTAPLLILNTPGSDDLENATSYANFKLKGNISELHTPSKILVKVYEAETGTILKQFEETNLEKIDSDGIVFAEKGGSKDSAFKELYDYDVISGDKKYLCEFTIWDNAKTYKNNSSSSDEGNKTSVFYFYDDVYSAWLSQSCGLGYDSVRKIVSQTYTGEYVNTPISIYTYDESNSKINRLEEQQMPNGQAAFDYVFNNFKREKAAFILNKDANPKYSITGYACDNYDDAREASGEDSIYVNLSAGRNGTMVEPKTLKVYQVGPFDQLTDAIVNEIYIDPLEYQENHPELPGIVREIFDNKDYKASSVEAYTTGDGEVVLKALKGGRYYVIAVTGQDKEGANIQPNGRYILRGRTSDAPPVISWPTIEKTPADQVNSIDDQGVFGSGEVVFSGSLTSETEVENVYYSAKIYAEDDEETVLREVKGSLKDGNVTYSPVTGKWTFSSKNGEGYEDIPEGEEYICVITFSALNQGGISTKERRIHIDTKKPVVEINSVTPTKTVNDKTCVNGIIAVSGTVNETNLKNVYYEIYSDGNLVGSKVDLGAKYSFNGESVSINTRDSSLNIEDNKNLEIKVTAVDKAGNSFTYSTTEYNSNHAIFVDQSTDIPVITGSNFDAALVDEANFDVETSTNIFTGSTNKLMGSVEDDDGLASVKITYYVNGESTPIANDSATLAKYGIKANPVSLTLNKGTTTASLDSALPTKAGVYQVEIEALDKVYDDSSAAKAESELYNKKKIGKFVVAIDKANPELTETAVNTDSLKYVRTNDVSTEADESSITFSGNVSDDWGIKTFAVKVTKDKDASTAKTDPITPVNGKWSYKFDSVNNYVAEGDYQLVFEVTDKAGKVQSITRNVCVDKTVPSYESIDITTSSKTIGEKNWYKTNTIAVQLTEKNKDIASIEISSDKSTWINFVSDSTTGGVTSWHASTTIESEGKAAVYVRLTDKAGNITNYGENVYIDTKAPVSCVSNVRDTLMVSENQSVEFTVTTADVNPGASIDYSGLDYVAVTKIGDTNVEIKGVATADAGVYKITIPAGKISSTCNGYVVVNAYDKAGNKSNDFTLFQTKFDDSNPVLIINSVSPTKILDGKTYVNGEITVSGSVTESNLKNVSYVIKSDGKEVVSKTDLGAKYSFQILIDTRDSALKIADEKSLEVIVTAEDEAGNKASYSTTTYNSNKVIEVKQSTDIPVITGSNFDATLVNETDFDTETLTNIFKGATNKLMGSVEDDDGLASVKVTYYVNGSSTPIENKTEVLNTYGISANPMIVALNAGSTTASLDTALPTKAGVYQVEIEAVDTVNTDASYNKTKVGKFVVAIDKKNPELTETKVDTDSLKYVRTDDTSTDKDESSIEFGGNVSDDWGIKTFVVNVAKNKARAAANTDPITPDSNGNWTYKFDSTNNYTEEGNYELVFEVTDKAGNVKSVTRNVCVDKTPPEKDSITVTNSEKQTVDSKTWYKTNSISVELKESNDDISTVEISSDRISWNSFTSGTKENDVTPWTATIAVNSEGLNKIYYKLTDKAGNTTVEHEAVYVDTKAPKTFTLGSTEDTVLVNGTLDVTFELTTQDEDPGKDNGTQIDYSGLASVSVSKIGDATVGANKQTVTPVKDSEGNVVPGKYSIKIDKSVFSTTSSGYVVANAYDKAGNKSNDFTLFQVKYDGTAPVVSVDDPTDLDTTTTDSLDVNGKLKLSGTASDANLDKVNVYYKVIETATVPTLPENIMSDEKWTSAGFTKASVTGTTNWSASITTTDYTDKYYIYVYAVAIDKAGNAEKATTSKVIRINQDTDRPVITLENFTLANTSKDGLYYWHTETSLQLTVEDDDGNVSKVEYSLDGTSYTSIEKKGTWTIRGLEDGNKTVYIRVTDKEGQLFTANANSTTLETFGPKIKDSAGNELYGYESSADDRIMLKVDNTKPTVTTPNVFTSSSADLPATTDWSKSVSDITAVGGTNKYLFVKVVSDDTNGIKSTAVTFNNEIAKNSGDTGFKESAKIISTSTDKKTVVVRYDLSGMTSGNYAFNVKVLDNAGKPNAEDGDSWTIKVDNEAPKVSFTTKPNTDFFGSQPNTIIGTTKDAQNSEIAHLYYAVNNSTDAPDLSAFTEIKASVTPGNISIDNWSIVFDGGITTDSEYHSNSLFSWISTCEGITEDALTQSDDTREMYLWMYVSDEYGNQSVPVSLKMNVIPNGDKPSVSITYPTDGASVGGNIRITGSTKIQSDYVDRVYIQIDSQYNGTTFNNSWAGADDTAGLRKLIKEKDIKTYKIVSTGLDSTKYPNYQEGILVNGTTSWSQTINSYSEFEGSEKICIRAFAVSHSGKVSDVTLTNVGIDGDSPLIGNTTPLELVQYAEGHEKDNAYIIARQDYREDMYLKGEWYLIGSIEDGSGISSAIFTKPDGTAINIVSPNADNSSSTSNSEYVTANSISSTMAGYKNYDLHIKVGDTSADGYGNLSYKLVITEGSDKTRTAELPISINYDNKAPEVSITGTSTGDIAQIYQKDGIYTVKGEFDEKGISGKNQSGFERVVMYYTRTLGSGDSEQTWLIDPMRSNLNADDKTKVKENFELISSFTSEEDLYWRKATGKVKTNVLTLSKIGDAAVSTIPDTIRPGGLVKINKVIYRILSVNPAAKTVTIDGTLQDISADTTVYFAAGALVVDNTITESGKTTTYNADDTSVDGKDKMTNGDGDQMVESAVKNGSRYDWDASIYSANILDGPVTVHVVAFDKAGNHTKKSFDAVVKNNAPRIAGVTFATDSNGNDTIEDSEWNNEYSGIYTVAKGKYGNGYSSSSENSQVTSYTVPVTAVVKGDLMIKPEIVGGNTGLSWSYTYPKSSGTGTETGADYDATKVGHSSDGSVRTDDLTITVSKKQFLEKEIVSGNMTFTVKDKTEGTPASVDVTLPVNIKIQDTVSPVVIIKPFFWKGSSENSLYNNSRSFGHIDLATDTDTAKLSGTVTIEGEASDDVIVNEIYAVIPGINGGNAVKVAYRYNGDITSDNNLVIASGKTYADYPIAASNWKFELISDEYDADSKNIVKFKLHLNTTGLNGSNLNIKFSAKDKGCAYLENNVVKYGVYDNAQKKYVAGANTSGETTNSKMTVDVVPYITGIETSVDAYSEGQSSVYSRTAKGHYSVYDGETITINGFNLASDATVQIGSENLTVTAANSSTEKIVATLPAAATSGKLTVTKVTSSLNNENDDDAKGDYTGTDENEMYNRQPNGVNNNNLTDDVYLDIWEFKTAANPRDGEILTPEMQIGPNGEVGFAFVNGNFYFNMAGPSAVGDTSQTADGTFASQRAYEGDYAPYYESAFVFDDNGRTYGISTNQDSNTNYSAYTTFYFGQRTTNSVYGYNNNGWNSKSNGNYNGGSYRRRLQSSTSSTLGGIQDTSVNRSMSPSIVATTNDDDSTNVYIAFYDAVRKQIRYRWGKVGANATEYKINSITSDQTKNVYRVTFRDGTNNRFGHLRSTTAINIPKTRFTSGGKNYYGNNATPTVIYAYDFEGNYYNTYYMGYNTNQPSDANYWLCLHEYKETLTNAEKNKLYDEGNAITPFPSDICYISTQKKDSILDDITTTVTYTGNTVSVGDEVMFAWNGSSYMVKDYSPSFTVVQASDNSFTVKGGVRYRGFTGDWDALPVAFANISGQLMDATGGYYDGDPKNQKAAGTEEDSSVLPEQYSVISTAKLTKTTAAVAIGVTPASVSNGISNDVVSIAWYDGKKLCYAYSTNPQSDDGATPGSNFTQVTTLPAKFTGAGYNVKMKVDTDGGIHLAFFTTSGAKLRYAYALDYKGNFTVVEVDNYSLTTNDIGLDVAKDASGNLVPYISYLSGNQLAKVAYPVAWNAVLATKDGISNSKYTGDWELAVVPSEGYSTTNTYTKGSNGTAARNTNVDNLQPKFDTICIGVHKDWTTGEIKAIPTYTTVTNISKDDTDSNYSTRIGGNNTSNPALAYTVVGDDSLQFAQMK